MQRVNCSKSLTSALSVLSVVTFLVTASMAQTNPQAVLSPSAYRALGQPDLRQNGVNMVAAGTLSGPSALALDANGHLYVADTFNHRVQAWVSSTAFQNGAPADLILGQPSPQHSNQLGIGVKGFSFPFSVAVDPISGNLY